MLNLPLALLSDDLFAYIVNHVAELPFANKNLRNLSIADRAFTQFCQAHIFKELHLGYGSGTERSISKKLEKMRKILDDEPSFANRVRMLRIDIAHKTNGWLFNDPTFISILQLLAKSPRPPHKLRFSGVTIPFAFEDPILIVGQLMQTFFSQTLTVLHLNECNNVPLTIFLICPKLREVYLDEVGVTEKEYPGEQCSGRELPALERLNYRESETLVKQMITPPPRFHTAVVLWSKLRVLTLCPQEKEEMACLQPILDMACGSLEELYLTNIKISHEDEQQLPLSDLLNLRDLSRLRAFALVAIINCGAQHSAVLRDINVVLNTIPISNKITYLQFYFTIAGEHPFGGCLGEDWVGICDQVGRISAKKPLELNLVSTISSPTFQYPSPGQDELYEGITEKIVSIWDYSNICTHFWHPSCPEPYSMHARKVDAHIP